MRPVKLPLVFEYAPYRAFSYWQFGPSSSPTRSKRARPTPEVQVATVSAVCEADLPTAATLIADKGYDRVAHTFFSAILLAATLFFWL